LALPVLMTRAEPVAREDPRDRSALVQQQDGQVASAGFADAGLGRADADAGNRVDGVLRRDVQVDGHGGGIPKMRQKNSPHSMPNGGVPAAGSRRFQADGRRA
jgi:hypothetical protein